MALRSAKLLSTNRLTLNFVAALPPGWDEAYTEDGLRYFIKYVNNNVKFLCNV